MHELPGYEIHSIRKHGRLLLPGDGTVYALWRNATGVPATLP
jgi:hypothetical protein